MLGSVSEGVLRLIWWNVGYVYKDIKQAGLLHFSKEAVAHTAPSTPVALTNDGDLTSCYLPLECFQFVGLDDGQHDTEITEKTALTDFFTTSLSSSVQKHSTFFAFGWLKNLSSNFNWHASNKLLAASAPTFSNNFFGH